jgi:hypothetical protein
MGFTRIAMFHLLKLIRFLNLHRPLRHLSAYCFTGPSRALDCLRGPHMGKEPIKFKYKNRRKPEYTKEGFRPTLAGLREVL